MSMKNPCAWLVCLAVLVAGCAAPAKKKVFTLSSPAGTVPAAAAAMDEGNRLFAQGQWAPAKSQYEAAIKTQPTLAEAHYNLALSLDRLGERAAATAHYKEAANLAPGHKVIWDAPPFKQYGVEVEGSGLTGSKNNFMDPKPY